MTSIITPNGARIFVEELEPEVSLVKRAQAAGLHAVVLEENLPKPTSGTVVAIGDDPLVQENYKLGDVVTFSKHAGTYQQVEGKEYRCLEDREVIAKIRTVTPLSEQRSLDPVDQQAPPADRR